MEDVPNQVILLRYGEPSKLDQAPFGTACKVTREKELELYIQMSHNEFVPDWQLIAQFSLTTPLSRLREEIRSFLA